MYFPGGSDGIKNPPAVQETQVQPLGRKDPLERELCYVIFVSYLDFLKNHLYLLWQP